MPMNRTLIQKALAFALVTISVNTFAADDPNQLETVTVTGTRTGETDLQQTPIAITTFDSEEIDALGLTDVNDIATQTPGLSIAQHGSRGQIYIRGIGSNNVFTGSDPSSTLHVDGVYMARPSSVPTNFLDVERVEVLKGPQGTLYGRNSVGGTVNVISREPGDQLHFKGKAEYGQYDKRRIGMALDGPLIKDALGGSFAAYSHQSDGYVTNLNPAAQNDLNDEDTYGLKGALKWKIIDHLSATLRADYATADDTNYSSYKPTLTDAVGNPIVVTDIDPDPTVTTLAPPTAPQVIGDYHTINVPTTPTRQDDSKGASLKVEAQLNPELAFTSLTSDRRLDTVDRRDFDFTEVDSHLSTLTENQKQFSQEFSLNGQNGAWKWIGGLYYFKETDRSDADLLLTLFDTNDVFSINGGSPVVFTTPVFVDTETKTVSIAPFAQGEYALNEDLSVIGGARYTKDEKESTSALTNTTVTDSWNAWTPKLGLNYRVNDDVFTYATISRGYKSGGFNSDSLAAFDPETMNAYEVGLKSDLWNKKLRFNAAAFYYDYRDLQLQSFNTLGGLILITNVPDATAKGMEFELTAVPTDDWQFDVGLSLLDTAYGNYLSARNTGISASVPMQQAGTLVENIEGNAFNKAPEVTANLTAQYFQNIDAGEVSYRLNYYWQEKEFYGQFNDASLSQGAYGLLNASASLLTNKDDWQLVLYGDNLTDENYASYGYDFSNLGTALSINAPRTYGVRVIYDY